MDLPNAINNSIEPGDKYERTKTMYDVSALEVFLKNFLAGFGRALGGIVLYLIFLLIMTNLFITYALPKIMPFINEYQKAITSVNKLTGTTSPGTGLDTKQYQQFIKDLQQSLPLNP